VSNSAQSILPHEQGLRRLAASAALIHASLSGEEGFATGQLVSPELRMRPDGDMEAWVKIDGASVELFTVSPNKFGMLAFGFACDHFKMLHEAYWQELSEKATMSGAPLTVLGPQPFGADEDQGLRDAQPERMTAPALMALCQRMAGAPQWLMGALDDLEKGRIPRPPSIGKAPVSKPRM
jgi:hypothetical protein